MCRFGIGVGLWVRSLDILPCTFRQRRTFRSVHVFVTRVSRSLVGIFVAIGRRVSACRGSYRRVHGRRLFAFGTHLFLIRTRAFERVPQADPGAEAKQVSNKAEIHSDAQGLCKLGMQPLRLQPDLLDKVLHGRRANGPAMLSVAIPRVSFLAISASLLTWCLARMRGNTTKILSRLKP
jgi:hypothetical protein